MNEKLLAAYRDAMQVQDACNLSGVLHSWARHQGTLRDECGGNVSAKYRRHPVNVLFLSKVLSLMVVGGDCIGGVEVAGKDLFGPSFKAAREAVRED